MFGCGGQVAADGAEGFGGDGRGCHHLGTLRHRLLSVPARLVRHAGQVYLRLPAGQQLLARVLARLQRLPVWT